MTGDGHYWNRECFEGLVALAVVAYSEGLHGSTMLARGGLGRCPHGQRRGRA